MEIRVDIDEKTCHAAVVTLNGIIAKVFRESDTCIIKEIVLLDGEGEVVFEVTLKEDEAA